MTLVSFQLFFLFSIVIFVVSNVEKTEFVAGTIFTFGVNSISPWAVACALMLFPRMMDSWGAMRMGAGRPLERTNRSEEQKKTRRHVY